MKKIYIIDDDLSIIDSLTIVLEQEGFKVGHQTTEENVINNIDDFRADLIILDVMFPEDESAGFEMARLIKSSDITSSIPIIMLSAINEKGIYAGKFSNRDKDDTWLPVSEFVEKPINPDTLIKKINTLLA